MKGIQGLIVAVVLGLVGATANFYYLNTEAQKADVESFIGIKPGVIIGRGERLTEDNIVPIEIPKNHIGNLKDFAYLWADRITVKDMPVWRTLDSKSEGGMLLLQSDLKTPPLEPQLSKGERGEFITVPRNCDTSHVNPGDKVSFRVMTLSPPVPTRAGRAAATPATPTTGDSAAAATGDEPPKPEAADAPPPFAGSGEIIDIGPFVVVQIGNRLGSLDVMKAAKITPVQQNVLMVRVSKNVPHEEENYKSLMNCIQRYGDNCYRLSVLPKE